MSIQQPPVVPFFKNPLLQRFLQNEDNRRLYERLCRDNCEADRVELEQRFATFFFEMRFLGYVRKHIHYEAMHLLNKSRLRHAQEALLLNTQVGHEDGSRERIELLPDPASSVESRVVEETLALDNLSQDHVLHAAIHNLSEKQQKVLDLLFVQQLTEQEASLVLGVSQQAVNKVKRGLLQHLRQQLTTGRPVAPKGVVPS